MSTSNKMKIKDDPRIVANQQKILQYLAKVVEEQSRLKQLTRILMQEEEKFHNDMYTSLRMMNGRLDNACENIDSLHEVTDNMYSRVKSVYRHVKDLQTAGGSDFTQTEVDQSKMLNSTRQWNRMHTSSKLPRTTHGLEASVSRRRHVKKETFLDEDNLSDSEESNVAQGAVGGISSIGDPSDPNLILMSPTRSSPKPLLQPNITLSRDTGKRRQIQSPNIQTPENQTQRSPVPIANRPPNDTYRPDTRRMRPTPGDGVLDVSAIKHAMQTTKRLLTASPSETDIQTLMQSRGLELSPLSVSTITKSCKKTKAPTSRTVGLHTVVIIDTSSSINGSPLTDTTTFVNQMLDYVDNSAGEYGLEEHIAMVTCGSTVDVTQSFTNDFMAVRSNLDTLVADGRTPLQVSLALAFCFLDLHGQTVEMYQHKIPPRVIVLSDFQATSDKTFTGPDSDSSEARISTQQQVFKIAELFHSSGFRIDCVPVGNCNQSVCEELAKKSGGSVVPIVSPEMAGNFYRYQVVIGCVMNSYETKMAAEGQESDMKVLIQQFLPQTGLTQADTDRVEELLTQALEHSTDDIDEMSIENDVTEDPPITSKGVVSSRPRIESPELTDMHPNAGHVTSGTQAVYQVTSGPPENKARPNAAHLRPRTGTSPKTDTSPSPMAAVPYLPEWTLIPSLNTLSFEERADLPLIGTRVLRDKDWKWGNQDGNGPGTVVGHKEKGLVFTVWDNTDQIGSYRYRYEGDKFDVKVHNEPRAVAEQDIQIGCWVVRGPDWNRGDEDGGEGTVGVVIRKLPERVVMVRWPSRVIEEYKFGADNKWELKVTMTKSLPDFQRTPPDEAAQGQGQAVVSPEPTNIPLLPAWFWQDSSSQWRIFHREANEKIEGTFENNPNGNIMIHQNNEGVRLYLGQMRCEMNDKSHIIKREMVAETEIESLYEVEKFL